MAFEQLLALIETRLEAMGLSERAACLSVGLKADAIRTIRRGNAPKPATLMKLAKALKVPRSRVLELVDPEGAPEEEIEPDEMGSGAIPPGYVAVATITVRPGMGSFADATEDWLGEPTLLPATLIEGQLRGQAEDFLVMEVDGQSMEPIILSRDVIVADRRKTNPSQEGIFVLFDGSGLTTKWVSRVPKSDPPKLRIASENPRFDPYEILAEEARIIGRVVWYARQM